MITDSRRCAVCGGTGGLPHLFLAHEFRAAPAPPTPDQTRQRALNDIAIESSRRMNGADFRVSIVTSSRRQPTLTEAMARAAADINGLLDTIR